MSRSDVTEGAHGDEPDPRLTQAVDGPDTSEEEAEAEEPSFFEDRKRLVQTGLFVLVLIVGIYVLLPKILEDQDASAKLGDAKFGWILVAGAFTIAMFGAYVALFRGIVGEQVK